MALEAIRGIDQILLFRELGITDAATKLAFQTEHSEESTIDGGDSTATKDGPLTSPGTVTKEIPFTSIAARGDGTREMLERVHDEQKTVEVWQIDRGAEPDAEGKYPAKYAQGVISELSKTANAEDLMELSGTLVINGIPQAGQATLTEEQAAVVQYEFVDTTAITTEDPTGQTEDPTE